MGDTAGFHRTWHIICGAERAVIKAFIEIVATENRSLVASGPEEGISYNYNPSLRR